jgi:hypothetical protein
MKKAKIMLSAIAVIAILSGTLAFKAHYKGAFHQYYYCLTTNGALTGTCTTAQIQAIAVSTTKVNAGYTQFTTYGTFSTNTTACTITTLPTSLQCDEPLYLTGFQQ